MSERPHSIYNQYHFDNWTDADFAGHSKATRLTLGYLLEVERQIKERITPRPAAEYHEDMGPVLWWCWEAEGNGLPGRWMGEPPYVGSPNDLGFHVLVTTQLMVVTDATRVVAQPSGDTWVGGWPGYHTHFTPIPTPSAP